MIDDSGGVQSVQFENCAFLTSEILGAGPAVNLGANVFEVYFNHCEFTGVAGNVDGEWLIDSAANSGVVRASNVVTVTTQSAYNYALGITLTSEEIQTHLLMVYTKLPALPRLRLLLTLRMVQMPQAAVVQHSANDMLALG